MSRIAYCAIHPAIGVARVGDSPDEYFLGPEQPGAEEAPASYKDKNGWVKRQAVRFRVFAYDESDVLVRELTADDATTIEWTVHLVNRKGAADRFTGGGRRNAGVDDRDSLVIDPGPRTVTGREARSDPFDTGTFRGARVPLGELRTDDEGRLIVLGGLGHSASVPEDQDLPSFADNDGWHDDTSDGPVGAVVRVDGREVEVRPAWVVVAPPDFAPAVGNLVTLYDVAENAAVERGLLAERKEVVFERDILPLLARAMGYQWVNQSATRGHRRAVDLGDGVDRVGDFLEADHLALLSDPGERGAKARRRVFAVIRQPHDEADEATRRKQATPAFMPQLSGDEGTATPGRPGTWFTVTPLQYRRLARWAEGQFIAGQFTAGPAPVAEDLPARLDRAALEACVGGPFFPGIEMSRRAREKDRYVAPFRFRPDQPPGCMTENMAVPWQADFTDCRHFWWPAQRPDDVIVDQDYEAVVEVLFPEGNSPRRPINTTAFPRWRWDRGIGDAPATTLGEGLRFDRRHREMVNEWSQLGFVTPAGNDTGVFVETERAPYAGLRHRDYFHIMLNLHQYPDFLPTAWKLAREFIDTAAAYQHDPLIDTELKPFTYEERAFDARLDSIYQDLVDRVAAYDPAHDRSFRTYADAVDRVRQSGPLNQTDGVWLRNVATVGPIDDLTGFLTQIWVDEVGSGNPAQNHANIYTQTLSSVGINTAPIRSKEYAQDTTLLDSSFTLPLFQLVVSQFTDQFLPELLGMTLFFEWESVELATTARLLEHFKIDSAYYRLHVAIDNADVGHGAIAKRAVKRYLSRFGDPDVRQQQWQRIWNGYVAFRITGTLGQDLVDKLLAPSRAKARVLEMIENKRRYGALNHAAAGGGMTNNLFDEPAQLLDTLQRGGQVIPGNPGDSPFMQQMAFGGRMYKVFTPDEQRDWADWIRSLAEPAAADRAAPSPFAAAAKPTGPGEQPAEPVGDVPHLLYSSSAEEVSKHPRRTLLGHGAAH
jgi:hypothetical protein